MIAYTTGPVNEASARPKSYLSVTLITEPKKLQSVSCTLVVTGLYMTRVQCQIERSVDLFDVDLRELIFI